MIVWNAFLLALAFITVSGSNIREAKDEEFPFQVSIKTPNRRHLCGGAIITPTWVLSVYSCLEKYPSVKVSYGSTDSNIPLQTVDSARVILQNELILDKKNRLALIQLQSPIKFSKTVAQAKLPTSNAQLLNATKLSGWNVDVNVDVPPNLFVSDEYLVIPKDCVSQRTHFPIPLAVDDFCGMDKDGQNGLSSPGTIVSKAGIALGILPERPFAPLEPYIFVKLSEHDQWIKNVLNQDAQYISWVDKIPKDSGNGLRATSLSILMIVVFCLLYS